MNILANITTELQRMKPFLSEKYFVNRIGLFGSVTRNDFTEFSDIDIIVDFNRPVGIEFIDLANYLEKQFNRKIDLLSRKGIKDSYFKEIEKEIVYI
ncbi:MAG: nucleotidyltransferase family protein [Bacteroidetes bacterium]|nr:nucleotidyltransferase family protein [Bacteroidota bacterium]